MNDNRITRFVSKFLQWSDEVGAVPVASRSKLSSSLNRTLKELLPSWDSEKQLTFRPLGNSEELSIKFDSENYWLYRSENNLIVATISPNWNVRRKDFSKNMKIVELVSNFFHFSSQYIIRSRTTSIIGAICIIYKTACDFRTENLEQHRISENYCDYCSSQFEEGNLNFQFKKNRILRMWTENLNCLDPFVHRAIYQFWRYTRLVQSGFTEESLTHLDSCVSVVAEFITQRLKIEGSRDLFCDILGINKYDAYNLKKLYDLRCDFSAHPGHAKWWDFDEIYYDDLDEMRESVVRLLWRFAIFESKNRVVEPDPIKWSDWFLDNSLILLDTIWFTKIRH